MDPSKENNKRLEEYLEILLTPDGRGRKKKAVALRELCDCGNPNYTRDAIEEFLKKNP